MIWCVPSIISLTSEIRALSISTSKLQLYAIMFLISCDRTEIWTLQRWTESLNWDGRNQILTQELGRRKSPMFSPAPSCDRSFGSSENFSVPWFCLRGLPWRLRGGVPTHLPWRTARGESMVPSSGVFIWWQGRGGGGEKECSPWNIQIWRVVGFAEALGGTVF